MSQTISRRTNQLAPLQFRFSGAPRRPRLRLSGTFNPRPYLGVGSFFARYYRQPCRQPWNTGTLEGRSKHNHSTLSIRTCTTISTLAHWPDRNGCWWRNASRYSGAVLASNDYVVGPRPRTSGPGFRPARPGGLPDDSQRHRHNPVRSRGTPQQDIKKDNGHGVVVET